MCFLLSHPHFERDTDSIAIGTLEAWMRYMVRAGSQGCFETAKAIAAANAHVYVVSEGRLTLSTGDLSEYVKRQLVDAGATVQPEVGYSPE